VELEPGRSNIENLNYESQRANHLSYCCLYDTDVLLHLVYLKLTVFWIMWLLVP